MTTEDGSVPVKAFGVSLPKEAQSCLVFTLVDAPRKVLLRPSEGAEETYRVVAEAGFGGGGGPFRNRGTGGGVRGGRGEDCLPHNGSSA